MTPEAHALTKIDAMLETAGRIVQVWGELNLNAGPAVTVRDIPTPTGSADKVLEPLKRVGRPS